jgi:hypothetical protein
LYDIKIFYISRHVTINDLFLSSPSIRVNSGIRKVARRNSNSLFPAIPEFFRRVIGDERIAEWDLDAPLALNVYRLASGRVTRGNAEFDEAAEGQAIRQPSLSATGTREDQETPFHAHRPHEQTMRQIFPLAQHDAEARESVRRAITALRSINSDITPLEALRIRIGAFFTSGPLVASFIVANLHATVANRSTVLSSGTWDYSDIEQYNFLQPWSSCKLAASLVLVTASSEYRMFDALKFQSNSFGGLPTLVKIRNTPTASFSDSFGKAKTAAETQGRTTIIGVSLVDIHIFRLAQAKTADQWSSFAHSFVVGVGPEGVTIWQAWGEHGYRLDEYIDRGGARLRSWDEAEQFVKDFRRLAIAKVSLPVLSFRIGHKD